MQKSENFNLSSYLNNLKSMYGKLSNPTKPKKSGIRIKQMKETKKSQKTIFIHHTQKIESDAPQPETGPLLYLNVLCYDKSTGAYFEKFNIAIQRIKRINDLIKNIKNRLKFARIDYDFQIYVGNFKISKEMRLTNFNFEVGDMIICKPKSAPHPCLEQLDSAQFGGYNASTSKRILMGKTMAKQGSKNSSGHKESFKEVPHYSRDIYRTSPSYIQLCRMSSSDLSRVSDFKIWNDHGMVEFKAPVDLR